ncbi:TrkA-N domain protein [Nostocoides japonicum T1-X7]|uniref:TrkA-N domain protein n=1 Tax=Nostocoides japonicum T1-X7 TaxID=1194083 RepID=A0A077LYC8_9MICO|nr:NAD-binding protein [Tetrasphaera japonica]CCH77912.1 TrkA-N domain protein [Tetrasphaera japonica T1-X7]
MSNPLLVFWSQIFGHREPARASSVGARQEFADQASATIFLIMRRMRAPLITLIVIFAVSVVGLSLVPGVDPSGHRARFSLFDSFYVMSYTATTIGFGELPWTFTPAQRLWITLTIYLSVVGWAYAIGSLLTLLQDQAFRQALALQRFTRKVARLREPFLLVAGYGRAGEVLVKAFDALGQRIVVIDEASSRIDALELETYHADIPGLVGDGANPHHLSVAGLGHPQCSGVIALTDDDETNLSVTMTTALMRPDLPIVARTISPTVADRMRAFGSPSVVNPFDIFGDLLRMALEAPATYQLLSWVEAGPGAALPDRGNPPPEGRWVMCGYGRFGRELTADLRATGLDVTIIEPTRSQDGLDGVIVGDATDPAVLARARLDTAVGLVAGSDNDTTNLSMIANARRINPGLFLVARQNRPSSGPLFQAMHLDALLVPTDVVAHEVYAQISTPLLWRFIQAIPGAGDQWAADLVDRLVQGCGFELPALWKVGLDTYQAPAIVPWLRSGRITLEDLLRSPEDRDRPLRAVPLLLRRGDETLLSPAGDTVLAPGDEMLFAGHGFERRALENTLIVDATAAYVLFGQHVPASWVWRKLSHKDPTPTA